MQETFRDRHLTIWLATTVVSRGEEVSLPNLYGAKAPGFDHFRDIVSILNGRIMY